MTSLPRGGAARQFSSAKRRRAVATLGAVSAGLLALSACDKPTPVATVTVGTNSVNSEASCYNGGDKLDAKKLASCLKDKDIETIKVDPDASVRFGVDPDIAEKGWTILMNGQPLTEASKKTYRTIPGNVFFNEQYGASGGSTTVSIVEGSGTSASGLWSFKLDKDA